PQVNICQKEVVRMFEENPTFSNLTHLMKKHNNFTPDINCVLILLKQKLFSDTVGALSFIFRDHYVDFAQNYNIIYNAISNNNMTFKVRKSNHRNYSKQKEVLDRLASIQKKN